MCTEGSEARAGVGFIKGSAWTFGEAWNGLGGCSGVAALVGAVPSHRPEPDLPPLCLQQINQDLNIQLLKDGYRLDEIPDDEDLDLIPPKSVNPTCMCCQATSSTACHIQ